MDGLKYQICVRERGWEEVGGEYGHIQGGRVKHTFKKSDVSGFLQNKNTLKHSGLKSKPIYSALIPFHGSTIWLGVKLIIEFFFYSWLVFWL